MSEATAFAPGHITGFFRIYRYADSVLRTGSRGAGICIDRGVRTRVVVLPGSPRGVKIFFNGQQPSDDPFVTRYTLDLFLLNNNIDHDLQVEIFHEIAIPIGCGMGSSGAGALSLVLALNKALEAGMCFDECVSLAHRAEVELRTGLGTVMGEAYGGLEIRAAEGAPGYGKIMPIPLQGKYKVVCIVFGSLSTAALLNDPALRARINESGENLTAALADSPTPERFMQYARSFALNTGLVQPGLKRILDALAEAGITASMLMFGDGIFMLEKEERLTAVLSHLKPYGKDGELIVSDIDFQGARCL